MLRLNIKDIVPQGTIIITTADTYSEAESKTNGFILSDKLGKTKDIQEVKFASKFACERGLTPGTLVSLSFNRYKKSKQVKQNTLRDDIDEVYKKEEVIDIPTILIDGKECLLMDQSDVIFSITDYEYYEDEPVKSETKFEIPKLITNI